MFLLTLLLTREGPNHRALVKYFLVKALSSVTTVLGTPPCLLYRGVTIAQVALPVKLESVPGHNWHPSVVQDLRWLNIFIVSTSQKLLPLFFVNPFVHHRQGALFIRLISNFWPHGYRVLHLKAAGGGFQNPKSRVTLRAPLSNTGLTLFLFSIPHQ